MVKMGTVWDRTAEFLTDNLPQVLPIALFAFFVPLSIQGGFEPLFDNASYGLKLALRLIQVGFGVLAIWGSLTLTAMVLDGGEQPSRVATARLPAAVAVALLLFLGFAVLLAPFVLTLMVSGVDLDALARNEVPEIPDAVKTFAAVYVVAAVLAIFWLSARMFLVNPVVVDRRKLIGAIGDSWRLTRGIMWPLVGVMLLYIIVSQVAALATRTVFGLIFGLLIGTGSGAGGLNLAAILTSVIVAAVATAFAVLAPVFAAKLYIAVTSGQERAARS